MSDFILLMHSDAKDSQVAGDAERWERYLEVLRASGNFDGGSSIGSGALFNRGLEPRVIESGGSGYLRIRAKNLEEASYGLTGNPVFEAGGTVEVRELLKD